MAFANRQTRDSIRLVTDTVRGKRDKVQNEKGGRDTDLIDGVCDLVDDGAFSFSTLIACPADVVEGVLDFIGGNYNRHLDPIGFITVKNTAVKTLHYCVKAYADRAGLEKNHAKATTPTDYYERDWGLIPPGESKELPAKLAFNLIRSKRAIEVSGHFEHGGKSYSWPKVEDKRKKGD